MEPIIVFPKVMNPKDDLFQNSDQSECNLSSDGSDVPDFSDACLKFIGDILLEEDLDENPVSVEEYAALLETEKSLYDALKPSAKGDTLVDKPNETPQLDGMVENFHSSECSVDGDTLAPLLGSLVENFHSSECSAEGDLLAHRDLGPWVETMVGDFHSTDCFSSCFEGSGKTPDDVLDGYCVNGDTNGGSLVKPLMGLNDSFVSRSSNSCDDSGDSGTTRTSSPVSILSPAGTDLQGKFVKKSHHRDDDDEVYVEGRNNKQQASYNEDYIEMKQYDDVLLCKDYNCDISYNDRMSNESSEELNGKVKVSRRRASSGKKQNSEIEEVDLRTLLTQCAQAVSSFDLRSANEILKQIRQHSTPYGDSLQRVAYLFGNGLEARLAGTGSSVDSDFSVRMSSAEFLKAYKAYMSAIPFKRTSYFIANHAILKLAKNTTKIHIIDFGISLGLQWPCLIQNLSEMSCPPKLRITGVDYPKQGFRPAERVKATGDRLSGYCDRFNIQFEYHPIAQKWDTIQVEDLKIESDELVIVNCMYRSALLLDELVDTNSPRDDFLRLIRKINPSLFVHGIVNGTFNAPFFITRFREALFHYSSLFDLFEATMAREDGERLLIETEIYGKEISNIVACEVAERVQRPETYKQWQVRTTRAGLRQLPLDRGRVSRAKAMVKANYHKDFLVDEDRHWILQGWKGRILYGLSIWQPN